MQKGAGLFLKVFVKGITPLVLVICSSILLFGCSGLERDGKPNNDHEGTNNKMNAYERENYVSIQEYTGEGFTLRNANKKIDGIIEENREAIVKAVETFFDNEYHTDVKVHHIASASDAASVFVESIGEPHFYTNAIVPIDVQKNIVHTSNVWSEEGQVEDGISCGLYVMAYEKEFEQLDRILENLTDEHPIVGTPSKVIERVKGNGYTTPYYFISSFGDLFKGLFNTFMEHPSISKKELNDFLSKHEFESYGLNFGIEFYMEEQGQNPSEEIHHAIVKAIEEAEGIPNGEYFIFLNDNYIDGKRGIGKKENSLEKVIER